MATELTDLQFDILDALYFVEPFETITAESGAMPSVALAELRELISKGLVQVMRFDEAHQDWVKSLYFDADDLPSFRFLATKEGLLAHNGRR